MNNNKLKDVTVSVIMVTYGHENYIKQAIEGVLMQECDFEVELIIADDESPDNTEKIIMEIRKNHSKKDWIKYTKHDVNKGMQANFIWAFKQAKGKYIAMCEGDDYWTDPLKLQKQVDFLEKNMEFSICFHKVRILEHGKYLPDYIEERYNKIISNPISRLDLLQQGNFIHTPSVVFRNNFIDFPSEFVLSTVGDYFLYIILTENGFIKRLDDVMAIYRKGVGVFSSLTYNQMNISILKYQACLLSYLSEETEKKIILQKSFRMIDNFNNLPVVKESVLFKILKKIIKIVSTKNK